MDLRRLDKTLVSSMENRAIEIVNFVQKEAQDNYSSLMKLYREESEGALSLLSNEPFLIQETFINSFVVAVRKFEKEPALGRDHAEMEAILARNGIWFFSVLDSRGKIIFQNREMPHNLLKRANPVIVGEREILIDLFSPLKKNESTGFIALRRSAANGTIVAALDEEGYEYWGKRIAIQKAIDNASTGEISFIRVMSPDGKVFGSAGEAPPVSLSGGLPGKSQVISRKINFKDSDIQEIKVPFVLDNKIEGIGQVGLNREKTDQILSKNSLHMIISMALIVLTGILAILFIYQNQSRHMARLEELRNRLQQSERLSSLGQLAAGVAHEIRNPLNAISMATQRLQRDFAPPDPEKVAKFKNMTSVIRDEVRRLNGIIEEFLAFSRTQRLELRNYPIEDVLRKLISLIEEEARARGISIISNLDGQNLLVPMDVDKLQQALLNILKNAMESIAGNGEITINVEKSAGSVNLKMSDTGAGLRPEDLEKIFNPEYTTKEKGLGLGLPIAHEIIRGHNGIIKVESRVGAGTTFSIVLPLAL
ncbi:MAG: ATP-binding protein [Syntrophaceae bacterium]